MDPVPWMEKLNDAQKEAVQATEGYVRVIAGAGSGKTRVLTYRLAYLVTVLGILPENILSVTFTNKAAGEMRRRIRDLLGENSAALVNTFHGFCVTILREEIHHLFYPNRFLILDVEDQKALLRELYGEMGISARDFSYSEILHEISSRKSNGLYVATVCDPAFQAGPPPSGGEVPDKRAAIFSGYLAKQRKLYALDFDDLIQFVLHLFLTVPEVLAKWQERIQYLQVDEFQDVSSRDYELACLLSGKYGNLFVVGDPDQTIYSWRGANIRYINEFDRELPNVRTIVLDRNYRSSPSILSVSNSLIRHNVNRIEKQLVPVRQSVFRVLHHHARTAKEEGWWIARKILSLREQFGLEFSDFAVLYRANYVSRVIEEAFVRNKVPYTLYNGTEFYSRAEIKDCLSYLRLLAFHDDLSFLRVVNLPSRGIGKTRIAFLKEYAAKNGTTLFEAFRRNGSDRIFARTGASEFLDAIAEGERLVDHVPVSDLLDFLLKKTGYEAELLAGGDDDRKNNVAELKESIDDFEKDAGEPTTLADYLSRIALFTDLSRRERGDSVKLMTIHAAKGLEFPYVFVCAMNEGIFPSQRSRDRRDIEEERRIAYVAFTRAEDGLFLTDAEGINFDGSPRVPSRFLLNIDAELYDHDGRIDPALWNVTRQYEKVTDWDETPEAEAPEAIGVKSRVRHPVFGNGTVLGVSPDRRFFTVKFDAIPLPKNISSDFRGLTLAEE